MAVRTDKVGVVVSGMRKDELMERKTEGRIIVKDRSCVRAPKERDNARVDGCRGVSTSKPDGNLNSLVSPYH
jgi:hypothetical protein